MLTGNHARGVDSSAHEEGSTEEAQRSDDSPQHAAVQHPRKLLGSEARLIRDRLRQHAGSPHCSENANERLYNDDEMPYFIVKHERSLEGCEIF